MQKKCYCCGCKKENSLSFIMNFAYQHAPLQVLILVEGTLKVTCYIYVRMHGAVNHIKLKLISINTHHNKLFTL